MNYVKSTEFINKLVSSKLTTRETILTIHRLVDGFNTNLIQNFNFVELALQSNNIEIAAMIVEARIKANVRNQIDNETLLKLLREPEKFRDDELK